MITFICLMIVSGAHLITFFQWMKSRRQLDMIRSWLAEEERAEERLLDLDPDFAARLGIKRKIDTTERVIEYRGQPPQVEQLANAILQHGTRSPIAQQALHARQQSPLGNLLGGIGGGFGV